MKVSSDRQYWALQINNSFSRQRLLNYLSTQWPYQLTLHIVWYFYLFIYLFLILLEINKSIKGGEEKHYYHERHWGTLEIRSVPSQPWLSPRLKGRGSPGPQAVTCQGPSLTEAQAWGSITWGSRHQETPLKSQGSFATMDSSSQDCITKTVTVFFSSLPKWDLQFCVSTLFSCRLYNKNKI